MKVVISHNLPENNAIECSKNILENLKEKHGDKISNMAQSWDRNKSDFSFTLGKFNVAGNIKVNEKDVVIEGKLPFAARMFSGLIENTIKETAEDMLKKCSEFIV